MLSSPPQPLPPIVIISAISISSSVIFHISGISIGTIRIQRHFHSGTDFGKGLIMNVAIWKF